MSDRLPSTVDEVGVDASPEPAVDASPRPWRGGPVVKLLRGVGWTLIYLGVLILGFVVHQLFLTDFFAERAQGGLEEELDQRLAVSEPAEAILNPDTGEVVEIPEEGFDPTVADIDFGEYEDFTFVHETAPDLGAAVGIIRIPEVDLRWTIVEGVRLGSDLKKGAGHYPNTPLPGQPGNSAIAGHRTTWGAPFHDLDELEPGDQVFWESLSGTHTYEVRDIQIVEPSALWVLDDRDGGWLTLTTCHPKYSARERLVVFAEMVDGPNANIILGQS